MGHLLSVQPEAANVLKPEGQHSEPVNNDVAHLRVTLLYLVDGEARVHEVEHDRSKFGKQDAVAYRR